MSGDKTKWYVADQCTVTHSEYYGTMFTEGGKKLIANLNANPPLYGFSEVYCPHSFTITQRGVEGFKTFGAKISLTSVTELLKKNDMTAAEIAFMPHQTSSVLIDYWLKNLNPKPAQLVTTITEIANVTVATHSLNMAWFEEKRKIKKNKLVMMALGPDMHANAMLLIRD
jgi:3-oxoacyl-[acyl-carrier-protein] synthase III